jgi:hypothetical protein
MNFSSHLKSDKNKRKKGERKAKQKSNRSQEGERNQTYLGTETCNEREWEGRRKAWGKRFKV